MLKRPQLVLFLLQELEQQRGPPLWECVGVWKSVRGLSLQDGALLSQLGLLAADWNCCGLVAGSAGTAAASVTAARGASWKICRRMEGPGVKGQRLQKLLQEEDLHHHVLMLLPTRTSPSPLLPS